MPSPPPPPLPTVTVAVIANAFRGGSQGVFRFTRDSSSGYLSISFGFSGTATVGVDYVNPGTTAVFSPGNLTCDLDITGLSDGGAGGSKTIILTLFPDLMTWQSGSPDTASMTLLEPVTGSIPFAMVGHSPLTAALALFASGSSGTAEVTSLPLSTLGHSPLTGSVPLVIRGKDTVSGAVPFSVYGHSPLTGSMPFYATGPHPASVGLLMEITGYGGAPSSTIPLTVTGASHQQGVGSLPFALLAGVGTPSASLFMTMPVPDIGDASVSLLMSIQGRNANASGSVPFMVTGETWVRQASIPLSLAGPSSGECSTTLLMSIRTGMGGILPFVLYGPPIDESGSIFLSIKGAQPVSGALALSLPDTKGQLHGNLSLFSNGW